MIGQAEDMHTCLATIIWTYIAITLWHGNSSLWLHCLPALPFPIDGLVDGDCFTPPKCMQARIFVILKIPVAI